ncbi:MAG: hypothetical protein QM679_03780 [Patulibacter sp.]
MCGTSPRSPLRVLSQRELVQQRLYRATLRTRLAAERWATANGLPAPVWSDPGSIDPRVQRQWARMIAAQAGRIAHDELVDTFRDAQFDRLQTLGVGWVRRVQPDACGACLALADGTIHPAADRSFPRHTRCRCIPWPATPGHPLPPTGRQIFDSLTETEQDNLFKHRGGATKAQLLRDGTITLNDLLQIDETRAGVTDYTVSETPTAVLIAEHGAPGPLDILPGLPPAPTFPTDDTPNTPRLAVGDRFPEPHRATIPPPKLRDYALDLGHESGRHKARVFAAVGGLSREDWPWLAQRLLEGLVDAVVIKVKERVHTTYEARIAVTFPNGRIATVTTSWKLDEATGAAVLVSAYIAKKDSKQ